MSNSIKRILEIAKTIPQYPLTHIKASKLTSQESISSKIPKLYHYHIRKSGGTSINVAILDSLHGDGWRAYGSLPKKFGYTHIQNRKVTVGWNKYLIERGSFHYAFSHLPAQLVNVPKEACTFAIFRDPVERVLSYYKMIKKMKKDDLLSPLSRDQRKLSNFSFDNFFQRISKRRLFQQLYMFSRNFDVNEAIGEVEEKVDHVMFLDQFEKGVKKLSHKTNLPIEVLKERAGEKGECVSKKQKKSIEKILKEEVKLYKILKQKYG